MLTLLLLVFCFALSAQPLALQSFENTANDTWAYTANPVSTVPYFWGRTNQNLGGASAQSGSWYWASWLLEPNECSVSFANVAITPGTQHSVSFYYYSKNLDPATDVFQVCLEYDGGTQWNNWHQLLLDTQAWSLFSFNLPSSASTVRLKIRAQYANPNMDKFAHWDNFSLDPDIAQYTAPIVYNTSIAQRTDGSKLVDISYDLFDANGDLCEVALKLSSDGGASFDHIPDPANLSGDIGENIVPGPGKSIVWDAGAEGLDFDGSQYILQFVAEDGQWPILENFVFVPGGTIYPAEGNFTGGLTVSDFYIGKYELTNAEWEAVMGSGGGDDYPHAYVSWFGAIEYCNRRSLLQGITPCYSYLTYGTDPDDWPAGWNTSDDNSLNVSCDWNAIGYRLPSEAEWEYAARGGLQTHGYTYSGSNDLNEVGWYYDNGGGSSHPVGQLVPNELGTYDMSGNLREWVWDIYSGSYRVRRGGYFNYYAYGCTVSYRDFDNATYSDYYIGFRICRVSP
ncbi:MAG: formylglycine-generating enzyme family protein [Candidatus Cloacimonetes bacterium]|nr:formylglycine-generating enzyme family protein [Candidatus Cloacimonadota bacterium]